MKRLQHWAKRHPNTVAYMLITFVFVVSIAGIRYEGNQRITSDVRAAAERRDQICDGIQQQQDIINDLITAIVDPGGVQGVNLLALPSFENLDPATQQFLRELATELSKEGNTSLQDRLRDFQRERLNVPACTQPDP